MPLPCWVQKYLPACATNRVEVSTMTFETERSDCAKSPVPHLARSCCAGAACLALIMLLAGCAAPSRREAPLLSYRDAVPVGFAADVMYVDDAHQDSTDSAARMLWRVRQAASGRPINVLALSGGGGGVA